MENTERKSKMRAFQICTENGVCSSDFYIVLAHDYAEAESIYWNELRGYHQITSIKLVEGITNVAYRTDTNGYSLNA